MRVRAARTRTSVPASIQDPKLYAVFRALRGAPCPSDPQAAARFLDPRPAKAGPRPIFSIFVVFTVFRFWAPSSSLLGICPSTFRSFPDLPAFQKQQHPRPLLGTCQTKAFHFRAPPGLSICKAKRSHKLRQRAAAPYPRLPARPIKFGMLLAFPPHNFDCPQWYLQRRVAALTHTTLQSRGLNLGDVQQRATHASRQCQKFVFIDTACTERAAPGRE